MAFQFTKSLRVYKQILDRVREMTLGLILGKNTYSSKTISKLYYSFKDFSLCHTCLSACTLSHFSHVQLFPTLRTLFMGFSRQEYWACYSQTLREANSLRRTAWIVECSLLHRWVQGRVSSLARGPNRYLWQPLIPQVYVSKPTSPSTLDNVSKRHKQVTVIDLHSKAIRTYR